MDEQNKFIATQHQFHAMAWLFILTFISQLAFPLYDALLKQQSFLTLLLPSLLFISLLTLPSLWVGSRLGKHLGLGLINEGQQLSSGLSFVLPTSVALGAILLLLRYLLADYLPPELPEYGFRGVTGGFLVSLGAAIGEEIWFRFGLLTLLLYGLTKLSKTTKLSSISALSLITLVAVLFGVAHLPSLASYNSTTSFAVISTILGNVAVAILYGWSYWRYGLVMAILAHFTLDIVLHVIPALY